MSYAFMWEEEAIVSLLLTLFTGIPSGVFGVVCYVLRSMALYTIAQRRGLKKSWLAWVPVFSCWILGSLSDQYRYVVKGQFRSKRNWLLGLSVANLLLAFGILMDILSMAVTYFSPFGHHGPMAYEFSILISLSIPMAVISCAVTVVKFMALHDVYVSLDPENAVLFLVLSILIKIVEPFFLFFNREKDTGMPPRRETVPPVQEPEYKDYL